MVLKQRKPYVTDSEKTRVNDYSYYIRYLSSVKIPITTIGY